MPNEHFPKPLPHNRQAISLERAQHLEAGLPYSVRALLQGRHIDPTKGEARWPKTDNEAGSVCWWLTDGCRLTRTGIGWNAYYTLSDQPDWEHSGVRWPLGVGTIMHPAAWVALLLLVLFVGALGGRWVAARDAAFCKAHQQLHLPDCE